MDPVVLAVLSIFGGAALTAGAGFYGAWRQSRREHEKWLRERRFEGYRDVVTLHNMIATAYIGQTAGQAAGQPMPPYTRAAVEKILEQFPAALAPLALLGPPSVRTAADVVMRLLGKDDNDARYKAELALHAEMQKALGIED